MMKSQNTPNSKTNISISGTDKKPAEFSAKKSPRFPKVAEATGGSTISSSAVSFREGKSNLRQRTFTQQGGTPRRSTQNQVIVNRTPSTGKKQQSQEVAVDIPASPPPPAKLPTKSIEKAEGITATKGNIGGASVAVIQQAFQLMDTTLSANEHKDAEERIQKRSVSSSGSSHSQSKCPSTASDASAALLTVEGDPLATSEPPAEEENEIVATTQKYHLDEMMLNTNTAPVSNNDSPQPRKMVTFNLGISPSNRMENNESPAPKAPSSSHENLTKLENRPNNENSLVTPNLSLSIPQNSSTSLRTEDEVRTEGSSSSSPLSTRKCVNPTMPAPASVKRQQPKPISLEDVFLAENHSFNMENESPSVTKNIVKKKASMVTTMTTLTSIDEGQSRSEKVMKEVTGGYLPPKLSGYELSRIYQILDVDRDGMVSREDMCCFIWMYPYCLNLTRPRIYFESLKASSGSASSSIRGGKSCCSSAHVKHHHYHNEFFSSGAHKGPSFASPFQRSKGEQFLGLQQLSELTSVERALLRSAELSEVAQFVNTVLHLALQSASEITSAKSGVSTPMSPVTPMLNSGNVPSMEWMNFDAFCILYEKLYVIASTTCSTHMLYVLDLQVLEDMLAFFMKLHAGLPPVRHHHRQHQSASENINAQCNSPSPNRKRVLTKMTTKQEVEQVESEGITRRSRSYSAPSVQPFHRVEALHLSDEHVISRQSSMAQTHETDTSLSPENQSPENNPSQLLSSFARATTFYVKKSLSPSHSQSPQPRSRHRRSMSAVIVSRNSQGGSSVQRQQRLVEYSSPSQRGKSNESRGKQRDEDGDSSDSADSHRNSNQKKKSSSSKRKSKASSTSANRFWVATSWEEKRTIFNFSFAQRIGESFLKKKATQQEREMKRFLRLYRNQYSTAFSSSGGEAAGLLSNSNDHEVCNNSKGATMPPLPAQLLQEGSSAHRSASLSESMLRSIVQPDPLSMTTSLTANDRKNIEQRKSRAVLRACLYGLISALIMALCKMIASQVFLGTRETFDEGASKSSTESWQWITNVFSGIFYSPSDSDGIPVNVTTFANASNHPIPSAMSNITDVLFSNATMAANATALTFTSYMESKAHLVKYWVTIGVATVIVALIEVIALFSDSLSTAFELAKLGGIPLHHHTNRRTVQFLTNQENTSLAVRESLIRRRVRFIISSISRCALNLPNSKQTILDIDVEHKNVSWLRKFFRYIWNHLRQSFAAFVVGVVVSHAISRIAASFSATPLIMLWNYLMVKSGVTRSKSVVLASISVESLLRGILSHYLELSRHPPPHHHHRSHRDFVQEGVTPEHERGSPFYIPAPVYEEAMKIFMYIGFLQEAVPPAMHLAFVALVSSTDPHEVKLPPPSQEKEGSDASDQEDAEHPPSSSELCHLFIGDFLKTVNELEAMKPSDIEKLVNKSLIVLHSLPHEMKAGGSATYYSSSDKRASNYKKQGKGSATRVTAFEQLLGEAKYSSFLQQHPFLMRYGYYLPSCLNSDGATPVSTLKIQNETGNFITIKLTTLDSFSVILFPELCSSRVNMGAANSTFSHAVFSPSHSKLLLTLASFLLVITEKTRRPRQQELLYFLFIINCAKAGHELPMQFVSTHAGSNRSSSSICSRFHGLLDALQVLEDRYHSGISLCSLHFVEVVRRWTEMK